jgi:hypothetical protein
MYMTMTVSNKSKQNKISSCGYFLTAATCHHYFFFISPPYSSLRLLSLPLSHTLFYSLSLTISAPLFPPLSLSPSIAHFSLSPSLTHSLSQSIPSLKIFSPQYDSLLSSYLTLSYCISVCSLLQWSF